MIYFNNPEQAVRESISRFKENNLAKMFKLRNKLVDYYQYQSTEQYINKYFGGSLQQEIPLYTTNITKKIINRISMVYKDNPIRMYNNEQNDDITDLMLRKNYKLKGMERIHNLVGTMLVHVLWNEAEEKLEYRPVLEYEVTLNPDNPMEIMSVLYPMQKTSDDIMHHQEDKFIFWRAEQHYMIDSMNKITQINDDNVNPYGVLPFVTIQPNCVIDRVNSVNSIMKSCIIDPKCKGLIRDLEQVVNKDGTREIDKSNKSLTHFSDGFGYYIDYEFPITRPKTRTYMA